LYIGPLTSVFLVLNSLFFYPVPTGGALFEQLLAETGSRNSIDKLNNLDLSNEEVSIEEFQRKMFMELRAFHGYLLMTLAQLSTKCRKQLFFHTRNATFHGMTRAGLKNLAPFGFMLKLTSFDTKRELENEKNDIRLRSHDKNNKHWSTYILLLREIKEQPHSLWIDNFSKLVAWQIPSTEKDVYARCLWTGHALRKYPFPIDMSMLRDAFQDCVAAMPNDPLNYSTKVKLRLEAYVFTGGGDEPWDRYDKAMCNLWEVDNVPVRPNSAKVYPVKYRVGLEAHRDNLSNLYPEKLTGENISSNDGCARVLRDLYEEHGWGKEESDPACAKKYYFINSDLNIFDRIVVTDMFSMLNIIMLYS
jgi:hypothetical protein